MGLIKSIFNGVKNIATGGRNAYKMAQDSNYAIHMVKKKIIGMLKGLLKLFVGQFLIFALIIVVLISAVSIVFEMFSVFTGNTDNFADVNPRDMKEWSENLSDDEINEMQGYGASIHPKKIINYTSIEDESYERNVNINVPVQTKTWGTNKSVSISDSTKEYFYTRGDTAYPYRQWWQSTAGIDAINDTSHSIKEMEIIDGAKEQLKPLYGWADPMTPSYVNGSNYGKTSSLEREVTNTTTITTVTSGSGGSTTEVTTEEIKTWYPLPYLSTVDTMFTSHTFEYKQVEDGNSYSSAPVVENYSEVSYIYQNGEEIEVLNEYTVTTYVDYKTDVKSYELVSEYKDYLTTFMDFLHLNKIDTTADPLVIYYMAETLPQNYDFLSAYKDYIEYMEIADYHGGEYVNSAIYDGDFGDYSGGVMNFPVPSATRISSYFGYRIHPVTHKRKLHTGIDIPGNMGADVIAANDGMVSYVGYKGTYGNTVMINHGSGIETLYAHNSRLTVTAGQSVVKGQVVAKIGSTGRSTGPHSHFEIRKNGKAVDPIPWLR